MNYNTVYTDSVNQSVFLVFLYFLGDAYLHPWCSVHVVNPDRVWYEPWRFLMYGFVHNSVEHLMTNIITQLIVGLPLELSHSSWRVAFVYLFGIIYGGLGREIADDSDVPLAGASGTCKTNISLFVCMFEIRFVA